MRKHLRYNWHTNITTHTSTKYSPYYVLYGRDPIFLEQYRQIMQPFVDVDSDQAVYDMIATRAPIIVEMMPTAMENLAATQQRDINRYTHKRSGQLTPHPDNIINKGDCIYYCRKTNSTLQIKVGPQILRVINVSPNGTLTLEGADGKRRIAHINNCQKCLSPEGADDPSLPCELCKGTEERDMILCDHCNKGYHITCIGEPIECSPDERWWCPICRQFIQSDHPKFANPFGETT